MCNNSGGCLFHPFSSLLKKLPLRIAKPKCGEPAREALIRILKLRGEMTVAELCKVLKVTHTAVRRYLSDLQQAGILSSRSYQHSKGRPARKYHLTEKAAASFPSGYEDLVEELLDTVFTNSGHKGVMDFLRANNDRMIGELMPHFVNKDLRARVEAMSKHFADRGYMTDWIALPDGNFFLFHQNCAIYRMATRYRQLCILEPRLIECLLGVKISRQQYILKDQPICGYLIDSNRPLTGSE